MKKLTVLFIGFLFCTQTIAQSTERPQMAAGEVQGDLKVDGLLIEPDWDKTPANDQFFQVVPDVGGTPSNRTVVRVLTHPKYIAIGVQCFDSDPSGIVNFSTLRDVDLENEDHIRIVMDPFLDGQSGVIFAVNASGARYDALVANRGESENDDWDAIWEARTVIDSLGWSLEIKIPIQSLTFKKGLTEWGFNIERRIQRFQETIRWANVSRDQWFIQTNRAGRLTNLPDFTYGVGLNVRPSLILDMNREGEEEAVYDFDPSLLVSQRLGANIQTTFTVNTDFAETEVDTRQTNLTRFPLFFPERRLFFLEGADIFEFGFGLGRSIIPFFSRRIGLFQGSAVPVSAGGKINGRTGKTAFGGLVMGTREQNFGETFLPSSTMGVVRVKQNILKESSIGFIGTFGDPESRGDSWTSGVDFTYQTTRFNGNKNFLVGASGMYANRADLSGDQSAVALKIDYPNDIWDIAFTYLRIGESFEPSLGFVPRRGIHSYRAGMTYAPRPKWPWLRQMRNQLFFSYVDGINGGWQSYRLFTAPINWRLESGDRVEFNWNPQGEQLFEPFQIADEVVIPVGAYHFTRYRLEAELAAKRKFNGQLTWWFGTFFEGYLDEFEASINWNPSNILTFEFIGTYNVA
ncbi:MAG: DUF5916 domain-containing protein, partial [Bacteroidota bacterium]